MVVARRLQSSPSLDTGFMRNSEQRCRLLARLRLQRLQGQEITFLDLLQTFRVTECQDARDKVYAPLRLAPVDVMQNITVDYERPVSDVYLNVIQFLIGQPGQELDFLGYTVKSQEQSLSLPSWVPNWNDGVVISPLPKLLFINNEDLKAIKRNVYNASGGARLKAFISGVFLGISGVYCDTIVDIDTNDSQEKARQWNLRSRGQYSTDKSFETALRRTNAADIQYDALGRACARNGSIDFDFLRKTKAELAVDQYERQEKVSQAYVAATGLRNLCLTQKGSVDLVHKSAVISDKVYMFLGGQVLYTLRPDRSDESHFTYIGECCLHGLMDGEVITWVNRGTARIEELILT